MDLESLLDAIEAYMEARKSKGAGEPAPCNDWDCGLALEFSSAYSNTEQNQEVDRAKASLKAILDSYIDSRIEAILMERGLR